MSSVLLIAIVGGLGGMLGWGFADFFAKKTIDQIGDLTTLFWSQLIGVLPLLGLFLLHPKVPTLGHYDLLFLIGFGIVSALSYLPVYAGFGKGQISLLSPIFASYGALVALLSAWFLHEAIPQTRQLAIVIVFAGLIAISLHPREIKRILSKGKHSVQGLPEVLSATLVYSVWLVLLDHFIQGKEWIFFILVIRCAAALTLFIYAALTRHKLAITKKARPLMKYLVLIGLFDVMAYSFVAYGFSHSTLTSVVALLSGTFSIVTIILARVFLKERITPLQTLAVLTILAGIGMVAIN